MPQRRLFVGLKDKNDFYKFKEIYSNNDVIPHDKIHSLRLCHIHIWEFGSYEWKRHLIFRDYLKKHTDICNKYTHLKNKLSIKDWLDGNEYNDAKNIFVKQIESQALLWHNKQDV